MMGSKPKDKRGQAPGSIAHRFKDRSGNPGGRPRKAAPAAEETDPIKILDRIARTRVPVQSGDGIRDINYIEALLQTLANAALKNTREGFRMLQLMIALGCDAPHPAFGSDSHSARLLDDPIVKRQLEREMRRRLRQQGEDGAAVELMRDQYGLAHEVDEHAADKSHNNQEP